MKKRDVYNVKLDREEQEIEDSIEEWETVENLEEEIEMAAKAADNYFRKNARITLRISDADLDRLKEKAAFKGLPYQTFIASILHEYAAGHFVSADAV